MARRRWMWVDGFDRIINIRLIVDICGGRISVGVEDPFHYSLLSNRRLMCFKPC